MLKEDIGMKNGILRRRFIRELNNLKRVADYSSCDSTNLNLFLQVRVSCSNLEVGFGTSKVFLR